MLRKAIQVLILIIDPSILQQIWTIFRKSARFGALPPLPLCLVACPTQVPNTSLNFPVYKTIIHSILDILLDTLGALDTKSELKLSDIFLQSHVQTSLQAPQKLISKRIADKCPPVRRVSSN